MASGGNPKNISTIYDKFDNSNYGQVNYAEWLNDEILLPPTALTGIEVDSKHSSRWL
jgi:hypothetical protein